jgi:hypothetical protein
MADVAGVKQVLAQTQALERVQETARRQGEFQQQSFATSLNRSVDAREHRVNEGERPHAEDLDPNAKKEQDEEKQAARSLKDEGDEPPDEGPEGEELGRVVDTRA